MYLEATTNDHELREKKNIFHLNSSMNEEIHSNGLTLSKPKQ